MATYTIRGSSHNVVYTYQTADGARKQQWESYNTELEAIQRKAYIDFLQTQKRPDDIRQAALDYKRKRAIEKSTQRISQENPDVKELPTTSYHEDNTMNLCSGFCLYMPETRDSLQKLMTAMCKT